MDRRVVIDLKSKGANTPIEALVPSAALPEGTDAPDTVIGLRAGLRYVHELVTAVAPTDAPVLLLGETGSGKELTARTIHQLSPRREGPMVRVNCGAIPPGLVDSELFGHERGAFTGAAAARRGWFEQADGGTLLLDEIAELSPGAQVRLLRVLHEHQILRVGGERTVAVDVRVIAATHRDLRAMVAAGSFREDLWYRLSVFPIVIPPLRERRDDIPSLAGHFAAAAGVRIFSRPLEPSDAELELLLEYPWPGNVRELAAVIERAAILGRGHRLEVSAALGLPAGSEDGDAGGAVEDEPLPTLEEVTHRHIERALRRSGGQIEGHGGAAALLGVNPHTLRARMRRMKIDWTIFRSAAGPSGADESGAGDSS
ncbi:MAG: sigma-54 dependent transcriptional regulator [Nannocystaceae bacterium]